MAIALAGVAAAGTGVVLGLEARARINQLHGRQGEWTAADKRSEQGALHLQTAAQILTGVGATAMVAGATLYLFGSSEKQSASRFALAGGPRGVRVVWRCAF